MVNLITIVPVLWLSVQPATPRNHPEITTHTSNPAAAQATLDTLGTQYERRVPMDSDSVTAIQMTDENKETLKAQAGRVPGIRIVPHPRIPSESLVFIARQVVRTNGQSSVRIDANMFIRDRDPNAAPNTQIYAEGVYVQGGGKKDAIATILPRPQTHDLSEHLAALNAGFGECQDRIIANATPDAMARWVHKLLTSAGDAIATPHPDDPTKSVLSSKKAKLEVTLNKQSEILEVREESDASVRVTTYIDFFEGDVFPARFPKAVLFEVWIKALANEPGKGRQFISYFEYQRPAVSKTPAPDTFEWTSFAQRAYDFRKKAVLRPDGAVDEAATTKRREENELHRKNPDPTPR